ncbi:MAG: flagellar protein FlaG [Spirochaetales bacterium]
MSMEINRYVPSLRPHDTAISTGRQRTSAHGRLEDNLTIGVPSREEFEKMVEELQTSTETIHKSLRFTMNEDLDRIVVKVVDSRTDKVIKELPPESLQRVQARLREAIGLLLDETG